MLNQLPLLRSLLPRPAAPAPAVAADDAKAETPALLEALERRLVPSATVATGDFNHNGLDDLNVKINDPGAHVTVTENDAAGTTTVGIDADHDGRFDGANDFFQVFGEIFDGVKVKLSGNGERLDYLLASDMADVQHAFNFKLGSASGNVVNFDTQGHAILDNVAASLRVTGGGGNNTINVSVDAVDHSALALGLAPNGSGNQLTVNFFGAITNNSLVQANVLVGPGANAGNNVINANVFGTVNASELDFRTDGSDDSNSGHDTVNYLLAGHVERGGLLNVEMHLADGNDDGHVEVAQGTFGVLDHSTALITVDGGQRGDRLSVNSDGEAGTIPIDATSRLDILIAGGNGNDQITADFSPVDALRLDGEFILLVSGGSGSDTINAGLANTADSFGLYDVTLRGDEDSDRFNVFIDDPSNGQVDYDSSDVGFPTGFAIVAGGGGFNTANVFGNVALFNIQQS